MKCCNVQDKPSDHTGRNGLNNPPSCTLTRRVQLASSQAGVFGAMVICMQCRLIM